MGGLWIEVNITHGKPKIRRGIQGSCANRWRLYRLGQSTGGQERLLLVIAVQY